MGVKVSLSVNGKQKRGVTLKNLPQKVIEAIKDAILRHFKNPMVILSALRRQRELAIAAIFFQRVVARMPIDEDYRGMGNDGYERTHKKDNDVIREHWTAICNGKTVSAKDFDADIFENFNDQSAIRTIYDRFLSEFGADSGTILIENKHERYEMLEYGGYEVQSSPRKEGANHSHGLVNGYSMQAPYGMMRITQAEIGQITKEAERIGSIDEIIQKYSAGVSKQPSQADMKRLAALIFDRRHLSDADIKKITEMYR